MCSLIHYYTHTVVYEAVWRYSPEDARKVLTDLCEEEEAEAWMDEVALCVGVCVGVCARACMCVCVCVLMVMRKTQQVKNQNRAEA